jgi:hypothetical protein
MALEYRRYGLVRGADTGAGSDGMRTREELQKMIEEKAAQIKLLEVQKKEAQRIIDMMTAYRTGLEWALQDSEVTE